MQSIALKSPSSVVLRDSASDPAFTFKLRKDFNTLKGASAENAIHKDTFIPTENRLQGQQSSNARPGTVS